MFTKLNDEIERIRHTKRRLKRAKTAPLKEPMKPNHLCAIS